MSMETYNYKRFAINAAKDFEYGQEVIDAIKASNDSREISKILERARNAQ